MRIQREGTKKIEMKRLMGWKDITLGFLCQCDSAKIAATTTPFGFPFLFFSRTFIFRDTCLGHEVGGMVPDIAPFLNG